MLGKQQSIWYQDCCSCLCCPPKATSRRMCLHTMGPLGAGLGFREEPRTWIPNPKGEEVEAKGDKRGDLCAAVNIFYSSKPSTWINMLPMSFCCGLLFLTTCTWRCTFTFAHPLITKPHQTQHTEFFPFLW